jgi:hypothetical protein
MGNIRVESSQSWKEKDPIKAKRVISPLLTLCCDLSGDNKLYFRPADGVCFLLFHLFSGVVAGSKVG